MEHFDRIGDHNLMHLRIAVDFKPLRASVGKPVERLAQTNSGVEVQVLDPSLTFQAQRPSMF
jgi:hypothetical protein